MNNAYITRLTHARGFGITVAIIAAVLACVYFFSGNTLHYPDAEGLGLPSADEWFAAMPFAGFVLSLLANGATVVIMLLLNKVFNVFRSMTSLFIAFFAMMQLASPDLLTQFYTGTMLAVVVPLCMLLLFSCYRQPEATRRIFMVSFLLSAFTTTQYCYAFYFPAFLLGFGQMEVFNRRTVCAAIMGALTPWILLIGFGIIDPAGLHIPRMSIIFSEIDIEGALLFAVCLGVTTLLLLLSYTLNVIRTIAYNARARAVNGAFTVVSLVTLLAMCVDYRNITSYVPMLNYCAAIELTHYFSTHRANKSYIAIFSILAVYAALFVCQTVI